MEMPRDEFDALDHERLTERLHLVPIGPEHVNDLALLHGDQHVAEWYAGPGRWGPGSAGLKPSEKAGSAIE